MRSMAASTSLYTLNMNRPSLSLSALCVYKLLTLLIFMLMMISSCCIATTLTTFPARRATPNRVRTSIPRVIRAAIRQIQPDQVVYPDFSHTQQQIVSGYRVRVTLTYCTLCINRGNFPNAPILGQDFINRCNSILDDMIAQFNQPIRAGGAVAFRYAGIRGVDLGVRLEYRVRRVHDELIVVARRPSPGFVSPPPVTDLSKVQVMADNGSLRLHGQPLNGSLWGRVQLDYAPDDCLMDASYLVGDDWIYGEELATNEYLLSPGQQFQLVMQTDCNLVLYDAVHNVHFATGTDGRGQNCYTLMQPDCNLVVYDGNNAPLWASGTAYVPSDQLDCLLAVEDSGVIRIWSTMFAADYGSWSTSPLWEVGAIAIS